MDAWTDRGRLDSKETWVDLGQSRADGLAFGGEGQAVHRCERSRNFHKSYCREEWASAVIAGSTHDTRRKRSRVWIVLRAGLRSEGFGERSVEFLSSVMYI